MSLHSASLRLHGRSRLLWPVLLVHHIWTSAVADEEAVRFNLRLLMVLTGLFSLPDIAQGLWTLAHTPAAALTFRAYDGYILLLGLMELAGAFLLAVRPACGRRLILIAACAFYIEAAAGLLRFERGLLPAAIFAVCIPAEAWVIWFLTHVRTRAHIALHR